MTKGTHIVNVMMDDKDLKLLKEYILAEGKKMQWVFGQHMYKLLEEYKKNDPIQTNNRGTTTIEQR
jgi:hypothetical protein